MMVKKGQPFLPMFVGDFMAATAEWEGEEQALYGLLLMHQWALGHLPMEIPKLARLVRYDQHNFERLWPTVSSKFACVQVADFGGRLVNNRLEQHRAKSRELSEKNSASGKKGAEAKWGKDGERHPDSMADAIHNDGERHKSANGVTDGNPSHPIPSQSSGKSSQAQRDIAQVSPAGSGSAGDHRRVSSESIDRVFTHWRQVHRHERAQLDPKRRAVIARQLAHYGEADLCQAISGYLNSPHHMGDNDSGTVYDSLELILRDAKHIDAGLRFYAEPPRTDLSRESRRAISQTEDWVPPDQRRAS